MKSARASLFARARRRAAPSDSLAVSVTLLIINFGPLILIRLARRALIERRDYGEIIILIARLPRAQRRDTPSAPPYGLAKANGPRVRVPLIMMGAIPLNIQRDVRAETYTRYCDFKTARRHVSRHVNPRADAELYGLSSLPKLRALACANACSEINFTPYVRRERVAQTARDLPA